MYRRASNSQRPLRIEQLEGRRLLASVSGIVYYDANINGLREDGPAIAGRTVYHDANDNGQFDAGETQSVSNHQGEFVLTNLPDEPLKVRVKFTEGWVTTTTDQGATAIDLTAGNDVNDAEIGQATVGKLLEHVAVTSLNFLTDVVHPISGLPYNEGRLTPDATALMFSAQEFVPAQAGHFLSVNTAAHAYGRVNPQITSLPTDEQYVSRLLPIFQSLADIVGVAEDVGLTPMLPESQRAFSFNDGRALFQNHSTINGAAPPAIPQGTDCEIEENENVCFPRIVSLLDNTQLIVGLTEATVYASQLATDASVNANTVQNLERMEIYGNAILQALDLGMFHDGQALRLGGPEAPTAGALIDRINSESRLSTVAAYATGGITESEFMQILDLSIGESRFTNEDDVALLPFKGGALETWAISPHLSEELDTPFGSQSLFQLANAQELRRKTETPVLPAFGAMPIATFSEVTAEPKFQELVIEPRESNSFPVNTNILVPPASAIVAGTLATATSGAVLPIAHLATQNLASAVIATHEQDLFHERYGIPNCVSFESGAKSCSNTTALFGVNEIGMAADGLFNQLLGGQFFTQLLRQDPLWSAALDQYNAAFTRHEGEFTPDPPRPNGQNRVYRTNASGRELTALNIGQTYLLGKDLGSEVSYKVVAAQPGDYVLKIAYSNHDSSTAERIEVRFDGSTIGSFQPSNTDDWNSFELTDTFQVPGVSAGEHTINLRVSVAGDQPTEIDYLEFAPSSLVQRSTVNIFASANRVFETVQDSTELILTRTEPVDEALEVELIVEGTATRGVDYANIPTMVTFAAGITEMPIAFQQTADDTDEPIELAEIRIVRNDNYVPGAASAAVIQIADSGVAKRRFLYNESTYDGNDPTANEADDVAIVPDKRGLLPHQKATHANYTSYSKGINGIVLDVAGLADSDNITAADFRFRVGNAQDTSTWSDAPTPASVSVRPVTSQLGMDRITIIWPNKTIFGEWLEVTMLDTAFTGLPELDTSYFGNAPGESINSRTNTFVDGTDFAGARDSPHNFLDRAPIDDRYDFNRDSFVDGSDLAIARDNNTNFMTSLKLLDFSSDQARIFNGVSNDRVIEFATLDVDQNGIVEPTDAIIVINVLSRQYSTPSADQESENNLLGESTEQWFKPIHALRIINTLNYHSTVALLIIDLDRSDTRKINHLSAEEDLDAAFAQFKIDPGI